MDRVDVVIAGEAVLANYDFIVEFLHIVGFEWHDSEGEEVQQNAQGPDVTFEGNFAFCLYDFRGQIGRSPASVEDFLALFDQVRNPEVADFRFEVRVEEDVVQFDVPVDDLVLVKVVDPHHFRLLGSSPTYFPEELLQLGLFKQRVFPEKVDQVAPFEELED